MWISKSFSLEKHLKRGYLAIVVCPVPSTFCAGGVNSIQNALCICIKCGNMQTVDHRTFCRKFTFPSNSKHNSAFTDKLQTPYCWNWLERLNFGRSY